MQTGKSIKFDQIAEIVIRRRWLLIIPFCAAMCVGIYLTMTLPKMYRAETLILVEPQRVPEDYVRSVVTSDIDSRINTIKQQILSRSNIEKIIDQYNLFSTPGHRNMFAEDRVSAMRRRVDIHVMSAPGGPNAFTISYKGKNPEKVMQITNTLATSFISENIRVRESQATGTREFLEAELSAMRSRLEASEQRLKSYRERYMGELPEQLNSNTMMMERLSNELRRKEESLRDTKLRLDTLIASAPLSRLDPVTGTAAGDSGPDTDIDRLRKELANLELRYTDQHPDVIKLRRMIAAAEATAAESEPAPEDRSVADVPSPPMPAENRSNTLQAIRSKTEKEIVLLTDEISDLRRRMDLYQRKIDATPKREQELLSLTRDYNDLKKSYSSLLERKLEAEIAVNMEKKQQGEQFRILDRAKVPTKPVEPDLNKIFLFSVLIGLGLGGGLIFLIESFWYTFRSCEDIETRLNLPIFAVIPERVTPKARLLKRLNTAATVLGAAVTATLFACFASILLVGEQKVLTALKSLTQLLV